MPDFFHHKTSIEKSMKISFLIANSVLVPELQNGYITSVHIEGFVVKD